MVKIKNFIFYIVGTLVFLFLFDFFLGNKILTYQKNISFNKYPQYLNSSLVDHEVWNHDLKKNFEGIDAYNQFRFKTCTNNFGFRVNCFDKKDNQKNFDIAIIGDSWTESLGLDYEDSWVNFLEMELPNKEIINLGVRSFSPSLSYIKLKNLILLEDFNFKEVFVHIDIGDIENEALDYILLNDNKVTNKLNNENEKLGLTDFKDSEIKKENILFRLKRTLRDSFPIIYQSFFEIRYYNLPKPRYRYYKKYQTASWTFNKSEIFWYDVDLGIKNSLYAMNKIYDLLNANDIKLSIILIPWPNQLLWDSIESEHVKIFENFCKYKCNKIINFYPAFFNNKNRLNINEAKKNIKELYLPGDMHTSAKGNKLIASEFKKQYNEE